MEWHPMYCRHFNLEEKPFQLSSDNRFLWMGKKHARALDGLTKGIERTASLLVLTGDVGTGKTTLLHEIIQTLSPDTAYAHITDPSLELHYLFTAIATGLGFQDLYQEGEKFAPILFSFLQKVEGQNRRALIIIDEVHLIPDRFLAELISWSRSASGGPLTILLAGQLEFHRTIEKSLGRSWKNHVDVHAMLTPLNEQETQTYINQRLALAGAQRRIFIVPAAQQAHIFSKGIPRLINIACDQAMTAAYAKDMKIIDIPTFQEAVGILELPHTPEPVLPKTIKKPLPEKTNRSGRRLAGLTVAVFLGICFYYFYPQPPAKIPTAQLPAVKTSIPSLPKPLPESKMADSKEIPDTISDPVQTHYAKADSPPLPIEDAPDIPTPLMEDEAQVEPYSPPEEENKEDIPLASTHEPSSQKSTTMNIDEFINEVFVVPSSIAVEP